MKNKRKGIFNHYKGLLRQEVQKYCKENSISEEEFHFLSIYQWQDVTERILENFADYEWRKNYGLHWLNTECRLTKETKYTLDDYEQWEWVLKLPTIIDRQETIYVALEDEKDKLWIAEGLPDAVSKILYEELFDEDYYIVDKKYNWMITRMHDGIVMFVGDVDEMITSLNK